MLGHELVQCIGQEWSLASEQLLIKERQTVLIGGSAGLAVKNLGRPVNGVAAALMAGLENLQIHDLAEVAHLDLTVDQQEISRFQVPVRRLLLSIHEVDNLGRFSHIAAQLRDRDSRQSLRAALKKAIP